MAIACFVLVGVGVLLILLGAYKSVKDWENKLERLPVDRKQTKLAEALNGLAKLADAIKGYPPRQQDRLGNSRTHHCRNVRWCFGYCRCQILLAVFL